jgi:hypothetical protein
MNVRKIFAIHLYLEKNLAAKPIPVIVDPILEIL